MTYGDAYQSSSPRLYYFLGDRGVAYPCARVNEIAESEVIVKDTRLCVRCGAGVWFDPDTYAVAQELGIPKVLCQPCMKELTK